MRTLFFCAIIPLLFSCSSESEPAASTATLDPYHWMTGRWEMKDGGMTTVEEWTEVNDSTFAGESNTTDSSNTIVFSERMEFRMRNGAIYYVPTVTGQNSGKPIEFKVISTDSISFTAENKTHDFPQRIIYRLENDGSLYAAIEGMQNGVNRKEEFRMKKEK